MERSEIRDLRWPWHTYLSHCQSKVDKAQGPGDYPQTHFYEFGQLPFFLRACGEAGFTEANPPKPLPEKKPDETER